MRVIKGGGGGGSLMRVINEGCNEGLGVTGGGS